MQNGWALQSGTSHFLGQNFSKAQDITFHDADGKEAHAWTTSWGLSTRMVGALIMAHSDDDGLIVPPRLAPKHIVILPIYRNDEERSQVLEYCQSLKQELDQLEYSRRDLQVLLDDRDLRGGEKKWHHIKKGVPLRVEVGPRDIESNSVFVGRRDQPKSSGVGRDEFVANVLQTLDEIQQNLFNRALQLREENTHDFTNLDDFKAFFTPAKADKPEIHGGFAVCHFVDTPEVEELLKPLKVTARCMPLDNNDEPGTCIFTGQPAKRKAIFAKAY